MRTSLEVINRSAILLHMPDDHGNAVKVILEARRTAGHN